MKKFVVLSMVLIAGSVLFARSFDTGYEPVGLDALAKQKGIFKTTLVSPEADFSGYSSIVQEPVILVIDTSGAAVNQFATGRLLAKREKENVVPEFDEVVEFKRIVGEELAEEIARCTGLELVEATGPGTLILQPVVTDVEISSSSKNTAEDGRELPELDEGTIVFDLIDSQTGEIKARFADRRRCSPGKGTEKPDGVWPNLADWAEGAAIDLCRELEKLDAPASSGS